MGLFGNSFNAIKGEYLDVLGKIPQLKLPMLDPKVRHRILKEIENVMLDSQEYLNKNLFDPDKKNEMEQMHQLQFMFLKCRKELQANNIKVTARLF
jgi:hypothetical protein